MRLPARPGSSPLSAATLLRIVVTGALLAGAVFGGGRLYERAALGAGDEITRQRVERDTGDAFDAMSRALRDTAAALAGDPDVIQRAAQKDTAAARALFAAADAALRAPSTGDAREGPVPDLAVTVYSTSGQPLAWSGRPSELPLERLAGGVAWFLAPGALGLRLVYLQPVLLPDGRPAGSVAAERGLTPPTGVQAGTQAFRFTGSLVPVSIHPQLPAMPARSGDVVFDVPAPSGQRLFTAVIAREDVTFARQRPRQIGLSLALAILAATVLLLAGPFLDWRDRSPAAASYVVAVLLVVAAIFGGRLLLRLASPADWSLAEVFSGAVYASAHARPLLTSPLDFLLTALAAGSVALLGLFAVDAWRMSSRRRRMAAQSGLPLLAYLVTQTGAGALLAVLVVGYERFLRDTFNNTSLDLLHFSLHPWEGSSARLSLQAGLVIWHVTAVALAVLVLRASSAPWRVRRGHWTVRLAALAAWVLPLLLWNAWTRIPPAQWLPPLVACAAAVVLALKGTRLKARYRHGSQAFRLIMLVLAVVTPALVFYPTIFRLAWRSKAQLVETRFAPEALRHRETVLSLVREGLSQIDAIPGLPDIVRQAPAPMPAALPVDRAFEVWRLTSMAEYPLTSSVELYAGDGSLVSRFAFNLPEDLSGTPRWQESACSWDVYEEVSPFFAEERLVLHAGRALCGPGGERAGSIVAHAIVDYSNLPFIASQSPYVEFLRADDGVREEGASGRDIEYAVYGWSRMPLFASRGTAWPVDDATLARAVESRDPFWTTLARGDARYDAYILNDRGGIHALGFPVVPPLGHLVNLAEITVLATLTCLLLFGVSFAFGVFSRRGTTPRALFMEVRASFYRKLFLAFVAAAVFPVLALAILTRTYVATQMRSTIESEAVRTASAARRVVEDLAAPRAEQQGIGVDDNLMVWVSRLVGEDVNIFSGSHLTATSERNLFASGLLPTRTPGDVYRDLVLGMRATAVIPERVGTLDYMVAATSMSPAQVDRILTVPLTLRQQEIEREIDALDRRVLLAALLFILAGAGMGYSMAERIADPVNRLTRATRRIARGELDARIAATSSDELRRLVEDFNSMAGELQRQRGELERTHRLEAWAEMARQVAHEIKNPLTPIQLNAEHLRRVHADRGEPLSPVLQECVATILQQVVLLRQIASEFSSFASAPTARRQPVRIDELIGELINPYRAGLSGRIRFDVDVPPDLPPVEIDRTLVARALTNVLENALHAMPSHGTLVVRATHEHRPQGAIVRVRVADNGAGMDADALARAFEPYFSTKVSGTGLGLPIAKRNVELSGGSVAIDSVLERGTTVDITLPVA